MKTFSNIQIGDIVEVNQDNEAKEAKIGRIIESKQRAGLKPYRAFLLEGKDLRVDRFIVENSAKEYVEKGIRITVK